jgi:hypothetical protein
MFEIKPEESGLNSEQQVSKEDQFLQAVELSHDDVQRIESLTKGFEGEAETKGETFNFEEKILENPSLLGFMLIVGSGDQITIDRKIELMITLQNISIDTIKWEGYKANYYAESHQLPYGLELDGRKEREERIQKHESIIEKLEQIK